MLLGQAQPQSKRPQSRIVRSAGRKPCLCVPSASPPFSREWLTACLQQTPCRKIPGRFYYTGFVETRQFIGLYFMVFLFFGVFWAGFFPGQHQTSTACLRLFRENRPIPLLPLSRLRVSTSTPKSRAVSSNLTAPANPLVPRLCENRMAWGFFVPMLPWTGSSFSLPMPYMSPSCVISSHRLSKIQHQNRTPSFRFLRVSTTCGPLALSHAARLSKNFPFLCLLHRNF